MTVFTCGNCGTPVTAEVREVAFPDKPAAHDDRSAATTILIHPDDVRGLRHHPDRRRLNGCWVSWHDVRLEPTAVIMRSLNSDGS